MHNLVELEAKERQRFRESGQDHVFDYYDTLTDVQKQSFLGQLSAIPVHQLTSFVNNALQQQLQDGVAVDIKPFKLENVGKASDELFDLGLSAISSNEVAAIILAGGQGTRLGFDGPKGMYDIGSPSHKSLFQLICEKLRRLQKLASSDKINARIPLFIMTSPMNNETTTQFFEQHNYFGLESDQIRFFTQGVLPCLALEGPVNKIIMEAPGTVAMAPDGNGGIYTALSNSGMISHMSELGVKYLHVFAIDNALVKPADPSFIGYCIQSGADCGNKVVWKQHADEKVGVMVLQKPSSSEESKYVPCVVEYSDMDSDLLEQTDPDSGKLLYGAANICNHFYTLDFVQNIILPNYDKGAMYHIAKKKILFWDTSLEQTVTPTSNNGMKLESFIFDVFSLSQSMAIYEVQREEEFAPVKNAPGKGTIDSPDTAREMISNLAKKWAIEAGATFLASDSNDIDADCEISPLVSYKGEGLEELIKSKANSAGKLSCPFILN